jgi:hypothetical protein
VGERSEMMKYDGVRKYSPARLKLLIALIRSKCGPMNNDKLIARRDEITKTIEKLDASILPLE